MLVLCGRQFSLLCIASWQYPEFAERYHGYADTLQRQGCKVDADLQVDALSAQQSGHDAASTLLARGIAFDAIFAASDLIAIGAMQALSECGSSEEHTSELQSLMRLSYAVFCSKQTQT